MRSRNTQKRQKRSNQQSTIVYVRNDVDHCQQDGNANQTVFRRTSRAIAVKTRAMVAGLMKIKKYSEIFVAVQSFETNRAAYIAKQTEYARSVRALNNSNGQRQNSGIMYSSKTRGIPSAYA